VVCTARARLYNVGVAAGACRICNKNTAPFVLVDCNIGDGLIIAIVGCVLGAMASCIGYTNTPKKSAGS